MQDDRKPGLAGGEIEEPLGHSSGTVNAPARFNARSSISAGGATASVG